MVYRLHRGAQSIFGAKGTSHVQATLTGELLEGQQTASERKVRLERWLKLIKRFATRSRRRFGVHHKTVRHFARNKLNLFPYRRHVAQQLSETEKKISVSFAQLYKDELQENSDFSKTSFLSDEYSFSMQAEVNEQNCGISVLNVYKLFKNPHRSLQR